MLTGEAHHFIAPKYMPLVSKQNEEHILVPENAKGKPYKYSN
jgi:hypothetical protein